MTQDNFNSQWIPPRMALQVHAHYPDVFEGFVPSLAKLRAVDFFVSATTHAQATVERAVKQLDNVIEMKIVENRGRDILPFLNFVDSGHLSAYDVVVKIHTKKSIHRTDGRDWGAYLINSLLVNLSENARVMVESQAIALWPRTHPAYCASASQPLLVDLIDRANISLPPVVVPFPAGSMFASSRQFIATLNQLKFSELPFEDEAGQMDLTMAHAMERFFGVLACSIQGQGATC